jgi:hypothetical protein
VKPRERQKLIMIGPVPALSHTSMSRDMMLEGIAGLKKILETEWLCRYFGFNGYIIDDFTLRKLHQTQLHIYFQKSIFLNSIVLCSLTQNVK